LMYNKIGVGCPAIAMQLHKKSSNNEEVEEG
jgi:hypothetical protein